MQKRHSSLPGIEFIVADVRELIGFGDNLYTLIIDKGCLDALFSGSNFSSSISRALRELYRVMKNNGVLASFSHAPKLARVPYFRAFDFSIEALPIMNGGAHLTLYSLIKTDDRSLLDKEVIGGDPGVLKKIDNSANVSQNVAKFYNSKAGKFSGGNITIGVSADFLAELVAESAEMDG
jgi:hypothetical protein